jgi:hypothetical protein
MREIHTHTHTTHGCILYRKCTQPTGAPRSGSPNQPGRRATIRLTQPTRAAHEPDPVTGALHHPLRNGNRPHRAPMFKTAPPFSSLLLLLQFLLLAPSATPPLRNPLTAHSWRGAGCHNSVPRLSSPPCAQGSRCVLHPALAPLRLQVCTGPLLHRR